MRRAARLGRRALLALIAGGLAACGPGDTDETRPAGDRPAGRQPAQTSSRDTLVIHVWADHNMLGPNWGNWSAQLVFEPLFRDGEGRLVTRSEPQPDGRTWTYHLRSDVRWHDGVPLTARDVAFTIELQMDPGPHNWLPGSRVVDVIDDSTFRVTYRAPEDRFVTQGKVIWPRHLLEDLDPSEFWEWEFWTRPVGAGPFRYGRHLPNELLELEASPDYYRGAPPIERVIFKFGGNALTQLLAGDVDAIEAPADPGIVRSLGDDPRFRTYEQVTPTSTWAIYWNHRVPLFEDALVRRALTLAIDRRELAELSDFPDVTPIVDVPAPPFSGGLRLDTAWPYDPEEARRILEAHGWVDEDGDGIRERDGQEFRFTAITREITQRAAVYTQAKLAEVGVRMEIQSQASTNDALRSGEADAVFDRFLFRELAHVVFDDVRAPIGFRSPPELQRLLQDAEASWDPDERRRLLREALRLFREEAPVTVLYPGTATSIAHRKVRGLSTPDRVFLIDVLSELWIEENER